MNLQEKINNRIEQLEVELEQLNAQKQEMINTHGFNDMDAYRHVSNSLNAVNRCIQELKQLSQ